MDKKYEVSFENEEHIINAAKMHTVCIKMNKEHRDVLLLESDQLQGITSNTAIYLVTPHIPVIASFISISLQEHRIKCFLAYLLTKS